MKHNQERNGPHQVGAWGRQSNAKDQQKATLPRDARSLPGQTPQHTPQPPQGSTPQIPSTGWGKDSLATKLRSQSLHTAPGTTQRAGVASNAAHKPSVAVPVPPRAHPARPAEQAEPKVMQSIGKPVEQRSAGRPVVNLQSGAAATAAAAKPAIQIANLSATQQASSAPGLAKDTSKASEAATATLQPALQDKEPAAQSTPVTSQEKPILTPGTLQFGSFEVGGIQAPSQNKVANAVDQTSPSTAATDSTPQISPSVKSAWAKPLAVGKPQSIQQQTPTQSHEAKSVTQKPASSPTMTELGPADLPKPVPNVITKPSTPPAQETAAKASLSDTRTPQPTTPSAEAALPTRTSDQETTSVASPAAISTVTSANAPSAAEKPASPTFKNSNTPTSKGTAASKTAAADINQPVDSASQKSEQPVQTAQANAAQQAAKPAGSAWGASRSFAAIVLQPTTQQPQRPAAQAHATTGPTAGNRQPNQGAGRNQRYNDRGQQRNVPRGKQSGQAAHTQSTHSSSGSNSTQLVRQHSRDSSSSHGHKSMNTPSTVTKGLQETHQQGAVAASQPVTNAHTAGVPAASTHVPPQQTAEIVLTPPATASEGASMVSEVDGAKTGFEGLSTSDQFVLTPAQTEAQTPLASDKAPGPAIEQQTPETVSKPADAMAAHVQELQTPNQAAVPAPENAGDQSAHVTIPPPSVPHDRSSTVHSPTMQSTLETPTIVLTPPPLPDTVVEGTATEPTGHVPTHDAVSPPVHVQTEVPAVEPNSDHAHTPQGDAQSASAAEAATQPVTTQPLPPAQEPVVLTEESRIQLQPAVNSQQGAVIQPPSQQDAQLELEAASMQQPPLHQASDKSNSVPQQAQPQQPVDVPAAAAPAPPVSWAGKLSSTAQIRPAGHPVPSQQKTAHPQSHQPSKPAPATQGRGQAQKPGGQQSSQQGRSAQQYQQGRHQPGRPAQGPHQRSGAQATADAIAQGFQPTGAPSMQQPHPHHHHHNSQQQQQSRQHPPHPQGRAPSLSPASSLTRQASHISTESFASHPSMANFTHQQAQHPGGPQRHGLESKASVDSASQAQQQAQAVEEDDGFTMVTKKPHGHRHDDRPGHQQQGPVRNFGQQQQQHQGRHSHSGGQFSQGQRGQNVSGGGYGKTGQRGNQQNQQYHQRPGQPQGRHSGHGSQQQQHHMQVAGAHSQSHAHPHPFQQSQMPAYAPPHTSPQQQHPTPSKPPQQPIASQPRAWATPGSVAAHLQNGETAPLPAAVVLSQQLSHNQQQHPKQELPPAVEAAVSSLPTSIPATDKSMVSPAQEADSATTKEALAASQIVGTTEQQERVPTQADATTGQDSAANVDIQPPEPSQAVSTETSHGETEGQGKTNGEAVAHVRGDAATAAEVPQPTQPNAVETTLELKQVAGAVEVLQAKAQEVLQPTDSLASQPSTNVEDENDVNGVPTGANLFAALQEVTDSKEKGAKSADGGKATAKAGQPAKTAGVQASSTAEAQDPSEALRSLLMAGTETPASPVTASSIVSGSSPFIASTQPSYRFPPRGLVNTGNSCFINSPLQALLGCPPFCNMLENLQRARPLLDAAQTPTLFGLAEFANQLATTPTGPAMVAVPGRTSGNADAAFGSLDSASSGSDSGDGWSVTKNKRSRNKKPAPQVLYSNGMPHAGHQSKGKGSSNAAQANGNDKTSSNTITLQAFARQPLVPSALNEVIRKFNPEVAAQAAVVVQANKANGPPRPQVIKNVGVGHQEQQDAQEFLHFLLDRAHEELVLLAKANKQIDVAVEDQALLDDGEWAQVGKRNKVAVTRTSGTGAATDAAARTAINALFAGATKSVIKSANAKPSATVEPFMMLHLDIETAAIDSVLTALAHHLAPANLTDYKPEGSTVAAPAVKHLYLYRLPPVLVIHLKRFAYTGSTIKNHKKIEFGFHLVLKRPIIGDDCPDVGRGGTAEYKLVATVSHHGKHAAGGHYTADVLQQDNQWLRFNDTAVESVSPANVLQEQPYMLMYQRIA